MKQRNNVFFLILMSWRLIVFELGILRIGTIIKARRINFLHYLLRRNETEMMYQIFSVQWNQPTKNDWAYFVKQDLIDFRIEPDLLNLKINQNGHYIHRMVLYHQTIFLVKILPSAREHEA